MGCAVEWRCPNCGYALKGRFGIWSCFPEDNEMYPEDLRFGKYGKKFEKAVSQAENPRVVYSTELYRCADCGELRGALRLEVHDGDPWKTEPLVARNHRCRKCRREMNIVEDFENLTCPHCRTILETVKYVL